MKQNRKITRRGFIGTTSTIAAGLLIVPSNTIAGLGHKAPSDKLNIAGVGIGGMGFSNLRNMKTENIVALCDIDWDHSKRCFESFPDATRYWDWRKMYDEMGKSIDAVLVATADHNHAIVASHAMTLNKHVYVQKPLTHSVYESRLLTKLAVKHKVATSMGNQGSSAEGVRLIQEWLWNGEIGDVTKVEAFTDRPLWPQGLAAPKVGMWVPETMNWDLFIGPAKPRPYHRMYTPWSFRGWWDFGTGALGDMACHILHPVFMGLKLGYPTKVQGASTLLMTDSAPNTETIQLIFPARPKEKGIKINFPEVQVTWMDGGMKPMKPSNWPEGRDMNDDGGCVIFHGTKDKLFCGCYGKDPWLLSGRVPNIAKTIPRISTSHEQDWIRACKESNENRIETASPFSQAGPFNEMVVMGVLAVRLQDLNKELHWDGPNMQFTNIRDNEEFKFCIDDGMVINEGHPTFNKVWSNSINAKAFSNELIKHNYREGWSLPDMPA
ncbi:MAG: Gfo/Idh/MocA family oxidoreductase [Bacteroidales bacterium]